jgi:tRNA (guanine6-N2)-methyltransferase
MAMLRKKFKVRPAKPMYTYQVDTLEGLLPFLDNEFDRWSNRIEAVGCSEKNALRLRYKGDPLDLTRLRTATAAYRLEWFDLPRPKAFLGQEHLTRLLNLVGQMRALAPFKSFRIGAAGSDSSVYHRLAQELEQGSGLPFDAEEGELLIRFLPDTEGWNVLFRLSPKPLSARNWRASNLETHLNAVVAAAMVDFAGLHDYDRVFNPMCGSGTLLIERRRMGMPECLVGCDLDAQSLALAYQNVAKSGYAKDIELHHLDATQLPSSEGRFDLILCDPPWGDDIGSSAEIEQLYLEFLKEMARVTSKNARMVILCADMKRFENSVLEGKRWQISRSHQVYHGGHHPKMYLLKKT